METRKQTIEEFAAELSSKAPVPGGGGTSALAGALGNALGQMVANLTIGKKKYAAVEDEIKEILKDLEIRQSHFLKLADEDAAVFTPLAAAYGLPSRTDEEKEYKAQVMEKNLLEASRVPLEIMREAAETLKLMEILGEKGSRLAVSDVGVGVQLLRAALTGAVNRWHHG